MGGGKEQGISVIGKYKIDGEVKNSIGNGEARELICTIHGHELRGVIAGGNGGTRQRGTKDRKKK